MYRSRKGKLPNLYEGQQIENVPNKRLIFEVLYEIIILDF
jgi:hypothetical protein